MDSEGPLLEANPSASDEGSSSIIPRESTLPWLDWKGTGLSDAGVRDTLYQPNFQSMASGQLPLVNRAAYSASKRMRRNLGQSWITNRFLASAPMERDFQFYHSSHQLSHARRRLCFFALLLFGYSMFSYIELYSTDDTAAVARQDQGTLMTYLYVQSERLERFRALAYFGAATVLASAFGLLQHKACTSTTRWWLAVGGAYLGAYQVLLWVDVGLKVSSRPARPRPPNSNPAPSRERPQPLSLPRTFAA
eukprot:6517529-Prymnesium_polylepis.1